MEKVKLFRAKRLLIFALCFALCIVSLLPAFMFKTNAEEVTEGRAFTAADVENPLTVLKPYTEVPRTFAATVRFDGGVDTASPIISNFKSDTSIHRSFEITSEGKPAISSFYEFNGALRYEYIEKSSYVTFNYSVIGRGEIHLVAVDEIVDGKSVYKLYADGELVDTVTSYPYVYEYNIEDSQRRTRTFSLGCDAKNYFSGVIKNIALYSDALTAEEAASVYAGVDVNHSDIMAYYDFTSEKNTDRFIKDQTGNGHDASDIFESNVNPITDYAYSIAVVGDTQKLVYEDVVVQEGKTNYTSYIYEWIAQNRDEKNIQFVMGLGDVTEKNRTDEYNYVAELHNKLEKIKLPYSIIQGNHDSVNRLDAAFKDKLNFTRAQENGTIGYFEGNSLANYYMTFTVNSEDKLGVEHENKYLVLALENKVADPVIPWANQVIEEHPDHQVIITTHEYVQDSESYYQHRTPGVEEGVANGPRQLWMKLASQHENVIMVLSGHLSIPTIFLKNPVVGVNGNTVYEFLIDPQSFDPTYKYETGMVAMFYFSADGKTVKTEYVSTYKSLKAQELNSSAPDVISNPDMSNYTLDIGKKVALSDVECEYGIIPAAYANEDTYPFVLFKADKTFVGGYFDFGDVMNAMVEIDALADYNVLMRRHAEQCYSSDVSELRGKINIDLGGFILVKCKSGYLINISVSDNSGVLGDDVRAIFKIMNGTINKCAGEALVCVDYGTADTGLSKTFTTTVDFENVVLVKYSRDTGTKLIFDTKETGYSQTQNGAMAIVNSTFTNCTFDYHDPGAMSPVLTLSNGSSDRTVYNVKIVGSEIVSKVGLSFGDFAIVDDDANGRADSVVFAKGSDGEYIIQKIKSGAAAPGSVGLWNTEDGNKYVPGENGTVDGYKIYKLGGYTEGKYGNIPDGNDGYAILVFKNGSLMGGYNEFGGNNGAIAAAKALTDGSADGEKGSTVYIHFVDDASATSGFDNLGQSCGNIIIDLDGHTLTQKHTDKSIFLTMSKSAYGMDPYSLTVINGNIVIKNKGILTFGAYGDGYSNAEEEYKEFTGKFENVNFSYAAGATSTEFLGVYSGGTSNPKKTMYNLDFIDCTFDFTNAASMATVMNINDPDTSVTDDIIKVNVYGGEIITSNNALVLEDVHKTNGSSINWDVSSEDNYVHMTVNGSTEAPTAKVNGGAFEFVKASETESSVTYTLEQIGTYVDGFGVLLDEHADADKTFVAFVDGISVGAADRFNGKSATAIMYTAASKSNKGNTVKILMLKDYTATASETFVNLAMCTSEITIDLNGHFFNANSSYAMFVLLTKMNAKEVKINLINGNVVLNSCPLVQYGTSAYAGKTFSMNFENVNFSLISESPLTSMVASYYASSKDLSAYFNMTFTDCVFDVTNAKNHITIFEANHPTNEAYTPSNIKYTLNGCEIKAKSLDSFTTWGKFNANSSSEYGVSPTTGLYTTITLPKSAAAPNLWEEIVIGGKSFGYVKESETTVDEIAYVTYALGEMTKYGPIPPKFESVANYPFVLFDGNGNCINASNLLFGKTTETSIFYVSVQYIKNNVYNTETGEFDSPERKAFILMRSNYDMETAGEYFDNMSFVKGTVVIDLNGFTLTSRNSSVMIRAYAKSAGNPSEIVWKNGNIVTKKGTLIAYQAQSVKAEGKQFIFRYEDINFKVEGATTTFFTKYLGVHSNVGQDVKYNSDIYLNNCTIDLTKATASNILMFDLGDACTSTNVTLNGVTIISGNGAFALSGKTNEASTGVLKCVGKGVTLVLPNGVEAPTDDVYTFVETANDGENVTYTLHPKAFVGYKIKTSVTLYSNFVYNVYIPEANFNKAYVDGNEVEVTLVEIDGVNYYHVAINLPVAKSLDDIKLTVRLNSGDTTVDANWTLSVLNYAKSIVNGSFEDTTKTLVKDMLVYASAAYTYFDNELDSAKAAEVALLTEGYTKDAPTGDAKKPTDTTYFTDVAVYVGEVPSFRFYLASGYTASDFTFKVGSRTVEAIRGEGYVEIVMYAYMMLDDVTFTVKANGDFGAYNIYSYYEYANTQNNANLVNVVEALMKYSLSAKAYRDSIVGK